MLLKSLIMLAILLAGPVARAEDIPSAPGWSLTKIQQQKADDDYSYGDGKVYFALKPPDQRPAVTIDSRTADRIRAGEASVEGIYGGQAKGAAGPKADEEYVYGNKSNGLVLPDPITSTLTVSDGRPAEPTVAIDASAASRPRSSSGGSSLPGLSGSSSSGSSRKTYAASSPPPPRNSSAASAPPPAGGGAEAPAAPSGPSIRNPADEAVASQQKPVDANKGPAIAPIAANNQAAGFGVTKAEKGKDDKDKNFVVWPNGEPGANNNGKPYCGLTVRKMFDKPGITRIPGKDGCPTLKVHVWGAGGGKGAGSPAKGGPGAYVFTQGVVDVAKFDVVVVVGGEGKDAVDGKGGSDSSFGGGGKGGDSEGGGGGGGGGGGFSGVFLIPRDTPEDKMPLDPDKAIAIAAGGGGSSPTGEVGGVGGVNKGGGTNGATDRAPGPGNGNGGFGASLLGGQGGAGEGANHAGGGGGGGLFGGGGGGGGTSLEGPSSAGGGGSSFYRFLDKFEAKPGTGGKPGNDGHSERGRAGDPGTPGKVILEFY